MRLNKDVHAVFLLLPLLIFSAVLLEATTISFKGIWWFDSILHFLGGVWVGSLFFYLFDYKTKLFIHNNSLLYSTIIVAGFVALIGTFWEFWEFVLDRTVTDVYGYGMTLSKFDPLGDTIKDLALDILGGVLFTLSFWKKLK